MQKRTCVQGKRAYRSLHHAHLSTPLLIHQALHHRDIRPSLPYTTLLYCKRALLCFSTPPQRLFDAHNKLPLLLPLIPGTAVRFLTPTTTHDCDTTQPTWTPCAASTSPCPRRSASPMSTSRSEPPLSTSPTCTNLPLPISRGPAAMATRRHWRI